jgi:hypothetical protein
MSGGDRIKNPSTNAIRFIHQHYKYQKNECKMSPMAASLAQYAGRKQIQIAQDLQLAVTKSMIQEKGEVATPK